MDKYCIFIYTNSGAPKWRTVCGHCWGNGPQKEGKGLERIARKGSFTYFRQGRQPLPSLGIDEQKGIHISNAVIIYDCLCMLFFVFLHLFLRKYAHKYTASIPSNLPLCLVSNLDGAGKCSVGYSRVE